MFSSICGAGANTLRSSLAFLPVCHDQRREHLERRDEAVARGREVGQDDVAGLFAADVVALRAHRLGDVAVADLRAFEFQADRR